MNVTPSGVDERVSALLSESIEEVLSNLLGDRAKQAVFASLARQGLERHQIPYGLSRFEAFLEDNFGRAGLVIERQIAKQFYRSLGLDLVEVPHLALSGYVDIASRRLPAGGTVDSKVTRLVAG